MLPSGSSSRAAGLSCVNTLGRQTMAHESLGQQTLVEPDRWLISPTLGRVLVAVDLA